LLNIACFDIVEFCPKYDPSGMSGFATAKIIREVLGIIAKKDIFPNKHFARKLKPLLSNLCGKLVKIP